jgi:ActR/RegA family two-component response regulator
MNILFVDDETAHNNSMRREVGRSSYFKSKIGKVSFAESPEEALKLCRQIRYSHVTSDSHFDNSKTTGLEFVHKFRKIQPDASITLLTNYPEEKLQLRMEEIDVPVLTKVSNPKIMVENIVLQLEKTSDDEKYGKLMDAYHTRISRENVMLRPLMQELEENPDRKITVTGIGEMSSSQLAREIEDETEIGIDFIDSWLESQASILMKIRQNAGKSKLKRVRDLFRQKK